MHDPLLNHVHMFNHLEYDSTTLGDEYARDVDKGSTIDVPRNYFPDDDPSQPPINTCVDRGLAGIIIGEVVPGHINR